MLHNALYKTLLCLVVVFMYGCDQEYIPSYAPKPAVNAKDISFYFQDRANANFNSAIYINNILLSNEGSVTKGILTFSLPDSLSDRVLTVSVAEYFSMEPPDSLDVDGIIFETVLVPGDLSKISALLMTRQNQFSPVEEIRIGVSEEEAVPQDGYFKVKFINVCDGAIDIASRKQSIDVFNDLAPFSEGEFIQLPFGTYQFSATDEHGSPVGEGVPKPVLRGAAGKCYIVFISNEAQLITEAKDFGMPNGDFAHVGIVNLVPESGAAIVKPITGSNRVSPLVCSYGEFVNTEFVKSGNISLDVMVGGQNITASYLLPPWSYVMAYIVLKDGQPAIQFVSYPMVEDNENGYGGAAFVKYLNFSPNAGAVSFGKNINMSSPDKGEVINILTPEFSSNLAFGHVPTTQYTKRPNQVYAIYNAHQNPNYPSAPLMIRAFKATDDPFALGDSIPGAKMSFPLFSPRPKQIEDIRSEVFGNAGIYSVILAGKEGSVLPAEKLSIIVINHSF